MQCDFNKVHEGGMSFQVAQYEQLLYLVLDSGSYLYVDCHTSS